MNRTNYSNAVKQFDNCSPSQIQAVSKSFGKLQKLRHRQNTCDEIK